MQCSGIIQCMHTVCSCQIRVISIIIFTYHFFVFGTFSPLDLHNIYNRPDSIFIFVTVCRLIFMEITFPQVSHRGVSLCIYLPFLLLFNCNYYNMFFHSFIHVYNAFWLPSPLSSLISLQSCQPPSSIQIPFSHSCLFCFVLYSTEISQSCL